MNDATQTWHPVQSRPISADIVPALILVGCAADPRRVGEVALMPAGTPARTFGREGDLPWCQQRPGANLETGPFKDPFVSRQQVRFERAGLEIAATNLGKLPLRHNGVPVSQCELREGDLLEIGDRCMILAARRPRELPGGIAERHPFGAACRIGLVGESPSIWALRDQVEFMARRAAHVLVIGPSGSGKELVAEALHRQSPRASGPLVSRNAATIPESLADAELFGNLAGYPNPQMTARRGLIGEADGGTLFLDEFGELPIELQARLLRVLDSGEYTRLGEARPRKADIRLIAATNRDPATLKHDVLARFALRLDLPGLDARREDVPLIATHLIRRIASGDPEVARRVFPEGDARKAPRMTPRMLSQLITHGYTTHVRELEALLWVAIGRAQDGLLDLPPGTTLAASAPTSSMTPTDAPTRPHLLDPAVIQEALDRHGGRQEDAWRELGLSSRHVLARLVKKYGLRVERR